MAESTKDTPIVESGNVQSSIIPPVTRDISIVEDVARRIAREEIENSEPQPMLYPMGIWDLNSATYKLKHPPIQIVVEEWSEDDFVANWHDVQVAGYGEGREVAIEDLCVNIIDLHEDLVCTPDEELGKLPRRWEKILCYHITDEKSCRQRMTMKREA